MGALDVLTEVDVPSSSVYLTYIKRMIDVVISAFLIVMVLPLLALLSGLIALDGHAPIYRQRRVGRDNGEFMLWKLRSMVPDADAKLAELLHCDPVAAEEWRVHQKLRRDPRITRVGQVIRKLSFDELPQLWNVLKGDMSLVGPRPYLVTQKDLYPEKSGPRLRPGLTGLWQVEARHSTSFTDRYVFDRAYEQSASFLTDVSILARTAGVVLRGTGC